MVLAPDYRSNILPHNITSLDIIASNKSGIVCTSFAIKADNRNASLKDSSYGIIDNLYILIGSNHHQVYISLSQTIYLMSLQFRVINRISDANLDIVLV